MENEKKKLMPINFSAKQKNEVSDHRTAKDKDGNPLKMCKIYLPSKDFRPADIDFGIDSQGIDRNERKGYINMPENAVFTDKRNPERMYTYLDPKRTYKIHFNGKPVGEPTLEGNLTFDKPKIVEAKAEDIVKIFSGRKERTKKQENTKQAGNPSKEKTTPSKPKKKNINMDRS